MALTITNLILCIIVPCYCWLALYSKSIGYSGNFCHVLLVTIMSLALSSCVLEVQIAAGFAAACYADRSIVPYFRRAIPIGLGASLLVASLEDWNNQTGCFGAIFVMGSWDVDLIPALWDVDLICCCLGSVAFYVLGVVLTIGRPKILRRRAWVRALSYVLNFLITFGARIALTWFERDGFEYSYHVALNIVSAVLMLLNGAGNVCIYACWMHRTAVSEQRVAAGSVGTALGEPRTVANDFDQLLIDGYFDLTSASILLVRSNVPSFNPEVSLPQRANVVSSHALLTQALSSFHSGDASFVL